MSNKEMSTYGEAWQALNEGGKVSYRGHGCWVSENTGVILYTMLGETFPVPYHNTEKMLVIHKQPKYVINDIHDDAVRVDVFGLTICQLKGTTVKYELRKDGNIYRYAGRGGEWLGKLNLTFKDDNLSLILDVKTITVSDTGDIS